MREDLSAEFVRSLLDYDSKTGRFTWRGHVVGFGGVRPKDKVGAVNKRGYLQIGIKRKIYLAHRLAWLWVHGEWPPNEIDHIDRNKLNNAIANLRVATHAQNHRNIGPRADSRLGVKGVSLGKGYRKPFGAGIRLNGKWVNLGRFDTVEEAGEAYRKAAEINHGVFARTAR